MNHFGLSSAEAAVDQAGPVDDIHMAMRDVFFALPSREDEISSRNYLVTEGEITTECCILLSGYACRQKLTSAGKRQIVSFHMAGDILDLQHLRLPLADHNIEAITPVQVAWVSHSVLDAYIRANQRVADALWRASLIEASIFREWVLNIGQRDARERIAHLLCEFAVRQHTAGLGKPDRFKLPMSQEDIADATGMTIVHVNRTLRALTEEGAILHRGRDVQILNWDRLRKTADFDPNYLHLAA